METPACPDRRHKGSTVIRAGWYGREGQRRQRWWCTPKTGARHRFTETLPRIVEAVAQGHACPHCATQLEPWEGQPAPRLYGFTARHVARALTHVAAGASYRATAAHIRELAGRELSRDWGVSASGRPLAPPTQHGQLVSDWVEVFAPVIWATYAPTAWPERVILDEDEFRYVRPGAGPRGIRAFYVLAVYGYRPRARPLVVSLEAVPQLSTAAWTRHLGRLSGAPAWVVTDGGRPVTGGAAKAWPGATLRRCEYHLATNLGDVLPQHVQDNPADELITVLRTAQQSVAGWERFTDLLHARAGTEPGFTNTLTRARKLDPLIRHQAATRGEGPHSTGPLETFFRHLETTIGDRAAKMTNKHRADALLLLLAAQHNGWVQEDRWTELIRDHLGKHKGRAADQRRHTDPRISPSLR